MCFFHNHLKVIPHYIFFFLGNPNPNYSMVDNRELCNKWNINLFKFAYSNNRII